MFFCHNQGFKLLILTKNLVTFKGSDGVQDKKKINTTEVQYKI